MRLIHGDCRELLPTLPAAGVDAVITDPPYPCIKRQYGYWTEGEWFTLMRAVVPECMRVLKPTGSAVFVLQPNSERAGRMRTWLWDFLAWVGKQWGVVQDMYWWNYTAMPGNYAGLARPSVKTCVWVGPADCYRKQEAVLWSASQETLATYAEARHSNREYPSGHHRNSKTMAAALDRRGGVTPFNVLPVANTDSHSSAGANGHGAGTPLKLCGWWVKYISPPGGVVLDPFAGSGTVGVAALSLGRDFIGVEKDAGYCEIARKRLDEVRAEASLFEGGGR